MTNIEELKAAISRWLNRDDLVADIPLFIQFAEAHFNRKLRTLDQEVRAKTSIAEFIALPTDYLAMRNIQLNTVPLRSLRYMPPEQMDTKYPSGFSTGVPMVYSIANGQIQLAPTPSSDYAEIEIIYFARIPDLASNGSNWLLTKHPDLYLFGSLVHAEGRIGNDQRILTWKAQLELALNDITNADSNARWSGSGLTVTAG